MNSLLPVSLVLCEVLVCQTFFTSLMGFMDQSDHFAMQCNSFFAAEMLHVYYNVFVSNKSRYVREQYFKTMLWMCNTNFSFIALILTKWMLAVQVYMLQTAEYCVSSPNMSMLKNPVVKALCPCLSYLNKFQIHACFCTCFKLAVTKPY